MVKTTSTQVMKKHQLAPDFSLKGTDGKSYSLRDFAQSKLLLVVFICNHCPYVKARIGNIVALQSKFNQSDISVVAINSNDPNYENEGFDNMKAFAKQYNLNFPYLIDDTQDTARMYGAVCTPDPFLFNSERKLVYHGKINDALEPDMSPTIPIMENNIRKLLMGQEVVKHFDPSIGCSIKWKN
jgi:peroxiredoxin